MGEVNLRFARMLVHPYLHHAEQSAPARFTLPNLFLNPTPLILGQV